MKILCLFVIGASAAGASSAQAEPFFAADSYPATIDGVAQAATVFSFGGEWQWECKTAPMQGKLTGEATTLTLTTSYEECRWRYPVTEPPPPFSLVQIFMNGCDWRLHALQRVETDKYLAQADLECPTGNQVVIELHQETPTICKLTVPAQSNKSDVQLVDETAKEGTVDDVKANITIAKLAYTQDSFFTCPVKQGTYEDLLYKGIGTLTATSEGKQIGFRVSGE